MKRPPNRNAAHASSYTIPIAMKKAPKAHLTKRYIHIEGRFLVNAFIRLYY